jgi:mono/diheme cytochrome c family protein
MNPWRSTFRFCLPVALLSVGVLGIGGAQEKTEQSDRPAKANSSPYRALVAQYCLDCHNSEDKSGGLALDKTGSFDVSEQSQLAAIRWEFE